MHLRFAVALMVAMVGVTQGPAAPEPNPVPMPLDRAADSYEIYSLLLEQGLGHSNAAPKYWLVKETTSAGEPVALSCQPKNLSGTAQEMILNAPPGSNPHSATPPVEHEVEFRAVLEDFDMHCHERVTLSADRFHATLPVHLADKATEKRFVALRNHQAKADAQTAAEFDGVTTVVSFSEVFFNPQHTLALVHQGNWCGNLCGTGGWVILERKEGQWKERGGYGWYIS